MHAANELQLMRAPARVYGRLVEVEGARSAVRGRWLADAVLILRRPLFIALVLGVVVAMASTGRVSPQLVARSAMAWSFAVGVQMLAASVIIAGARKRRIGFAPALDLLFASHGPWSLWLLGFAAWASASPPVARQMSVLMISLTIPIVWTPFIVAAFCRVVLGEGPGAARWRTAVHQVITVGTLLVLFFVAVQMWPRIIWSLWGGPAQ